jgi:copper chaperone NosL
MLTRNKPGFYVWCVIVGVAVFANCQKQAVEPVAIAPEDMCSYCKMAISEKQYAAELIDYDGQAFKFDDTGCMLNFIKKQSVSVSSSSFFVMDFEQRQWIKADSAYYVRSSELTTPMNGGIIAFKDQSKAREAAGKYNGKLLSFNELLF